MNDHTTMETEGVLPLNRTETGNRDMMAPPLLCCDQRTGSKRDSRNKATVDKKKINWKNQNIVAGVCVAEESMTKTWVEWLVWFIDMINALLADRFVQ